MFSEVMGAEVIAAGVGILALFLSILAAVIDFRTYLIPNWISFSILGLGVVFGLFNPDFAWGWNFLATVLVFVGGFSLFSLRLFGGGDVKLMTAVTFWCGFGGLAPFLLVTALFGGILSLGYVVRALVLSRKEGGSVMEKIATKPVPYGIAIAMGSVYVFLTISGQIGIVS